MLSVNFWESYAMMRDNLPVVGCYEVVGWTLGQYGLIPRPVRMWGFVCQYCHAIHVFRPGEGRRGCVCRSEEGQKVYHYGYHLKLLEE